MADGYARASGKPGIVLVTSGPGTSNLVTPLLNALLDGIPMVVVCGQVATSVQGTGAFQEINVMELARTCTKWSTCVQRISDLPTALDSAFYHTMVERPGPVLIAIPKDVGSAVFNMAALEESARTDERDDHPGKTPHSRLRATDHDKIHHVADLISRSQCPVICAGNGVLSRLYGSDLLLRLAEKSLAPVATTLLGLGCFDETHTLALGMMGTYGGLPANYAIQHADMILAVGARLDERAVGNPSKFAPTARERATTGEGGIVHFEICPDTAGKIIQPTELIHGDMFDTLPILLSYLVQRQDGHGWLDQVAQWKRESSLALAPGKQEPFPLPRQVIAEIDRQTSPTKDATIISTGVGQHQMWAAKYYRWKHPRSLITSGSLGAMGFGLPAAIGAQIAWPKRNVIVIDGDASFCMTMEELLTAAQHGIPVKLIIMNNQKQGMITQLQCADYGGRVCYDQQRNPDFVELAQSMGSQGRRCVDQQDLPGHIAWLLLCRGPALLEVRVAEENMVPIVPSGGSLSEMKLE